MDGDPLTRGSSTDGRHAAGKNEARRREADRAVAADCAAYEQEPERVDNFWTVAEAWSDQG